MYKVVNIDEERELIYNVTWLSDRKVTGGHVKNEKQIFFYCTTPVSTNIGRMKTYIEGNLPLISNDPLTMCSMRSRDKLKTKYLLFFKVDGHQT